VFLQDSSDVLAGEVKDVKKSYFVTLEILTAEWVRKKEGKIKEMEILEDDPLKSSLLLMCVGFKFQKLMCVGYGTLKRKKTAEFKV